MGSKIVVFEHFVWPNTEKQKGASEKGAIQQILDMVEGLKKFWEFYVIVDVTLEEPVDILYPGCPYIIKFYYCEEFVWPKRANTLFYTEENFMEQVLKALKISPELETYLYVSTSTQGMSLQYQGNGMLEPGETYYLLSQ
jgi:hypothetical protein